MKGIYKIKYISLLGLFVYLLTSCEREVVDFGNDRMLSGTLKDQSVNIVPGTVTKEDLSVFLLGEGETQPTILRVDGEGVYQNTKLFSQVYKAWIKGPVFMVNPSDTIYLDFTKNMSLAQDWIVTPYLSLAKPEITSGPTATSVNVSYSITGNEGKTAAKRELYCSTSPYPDTSRGSGNGYTTIKKSLSTNSGDFSVTGLKPGTKYYLRIGASANGKTWNYSGQIIFTTPAQ